MVFGTSFRSLKEVMLIHLVQLDKLVGLAMLGAATAVFLYYTVWTLLMVRQIPDGHLSLPVTEVCTAIRRFGSPTSTDLPPTSLGHSHTCHLDPPWVGRRRLVSQHCHDSEQPKESRQGQGCREEEGLILVGHGISGVSQAPAGKLIINIRKQTMRRVDIILQMRLASKI